MATTNNPPAQLDGEDCRAYAARLDRWRLALVQHAPHSPLARRLLGDYDAAQPIDPEQAATDRVHTRALIELVREAVKLDQGFAQAPHAFAASRLSPSGASLLRRMENALAFADLENAIQPLRETQRGEVSR